jgi:membrane associated rhomboid family serine protease
MNRNYGFRPDFAPKVLKFLILSIAGVSLVVALAFQLFGTALPFFLLSLNSYGVQHFFLWQLLTYLFVQPLQYGVSLALIINIFFQLYLLWIAGQVVIQRKGTKDFLKIFFGSALTTSLIASIFLFFSGATQTLAGPLPVVYALLTIWIMFEPELRLFLFLAIPVKAKWLVVGILVINFFLDFSQQSYLSICADAAAILTGYFIGLLAYELHSPFQALQNLENKIFQVRASFINRLHGHSPQKKIYTLKSSAKWRREEEFIDRCLEKISQSGKSSLTLFERLKLWWITKKRKR